MHPSVPHEIGLFLRRKYALQMAAYLWPVAWCGMSSLCLSLSFFPKVGAKSPACFVAIDSSSSVVDSRVSVLRILSFAARSSTRGGDK